MINRSRTRRRLEMVAGEPPRKKKGKKRKMKTKEDCQQFATQGNLDSSQNII